MEMTGYNTLWKAVVRPPKAEYDTNDLGPDKFIVHGNDGEGYKVQRTDFTLTN